MDILAIIDSPEHCRAIFKEFGNAIFEEVEGVGLTPGSEYVSLFGSRGNKSIRILLFADGRAHIEEDDEYTLGIENPFLFVERMKQLGYSRTL